MSNTVLDVPFAEKDAAKALGARWNPQLRKWYVPAGLELSLFSAWLPADLASAPVSTSAAVPATAAGTMMTSCAEDEGRYQLALSQGMPLSRLLSSVRAAIVNAFRSGVWTMVELSKVDGRNGHVYLELAERNPAGEVLATARGVIWGAVAARIVPQFQQATGVEIAPGIKLLVRAKPAFHTLYGFSLEIDAIDPDYTLGDLEAKKKEIRLRLQQEGIFAANRQLPAPWDFAQVLVISPADAAGLGDFRAEADRLQQYGLCQFSYAHSRFQGQGAAGEIRAALLTALQDCKAAGIQLDAVVIIRGGGAVNDLAWLNDYELAHAVCTLDIPVLTGIGHERDRTVLDEVAHTSFDTPSKVIHGIEQQISQRASEAQDHFRQIEAGLTRLLHTLRSRIEQDFHNVRSDAQHTLAHARLSSDAAINELRLRAQQQVHTARQSAQTLLEHTRHQAQLQLSASRSRLPALIEQVHSHASDAVKLARERTQTRFDELLVRCRLELGRSQRDLNQQLRRLSDEASRQLHSARTQVRDDFATILQQGGRELPRSRLAAAQLMDSIRHDGERMLTAARQSSTALFREIAGQGPEKTLNRGFALVRNAQGQPVSTPQAVQQNERLEIQFSTGCLAVRAEKGEQDNG